MSGVFLHQERQALGGIRFNFPQWLRAAPVAPFPTPWGSRVRSGHRVCPSFPTQRSWLEMPDEGGKKQGSETWSLSPSSVWEHGKCTPPYPPALALLAFAVRDR